MEEGVADN
jgi:Leucine-rich repeat (LRR) protein